MAAPPFRAVMVGPTGAGKSVHARRIARQHRLLHISFADRLRDLALQKGYKHAEAIKEHLASPKDVPLDTDVAVDIAKEFWDPASVFGSSGFILEGFPRSEPDAVAMAEAGLYPDVFVHVKCSPEVAERRTLGRKLREYQTHRARVQELRKRKADARAAKALARKEAWDREQARKRDEFDAIKAAKRAAEGDAYESDGEAYQPEEMPADEEEGGEGGEGGEGEGEGEQEQLQTDEEATERLREEIGALHDSMSSAAEAIVETCKGRLRVATLEVNGDLNEESVRALMGRGLEKFLGARKSLFETCYTLPLPRVEFLVAGGYLQMSRFGTWCPSQLLQSKATAPLDKVRYPVIYNDTVYYLSSKEDRRLFVADPLRHLAQSAPSVFVPLAVAVVGAPKSGKTLLAQRLASHFGAQVVTVESAWQGLQEREPGSELLQRIDAQLREGTALTDQLCAELLGNALLAPRCRTRGYILDGFPSSQQQLELFVKANQPLQRIFELELDEATSCSRSLKDHTSSSADELPSHDSEGIIKVRLQAYQAEVRKMREWCSAELRNWVPIDASKSKWATATRITHEAELALVQHEEHLDALLHGEAAPLVGIPVPRATLQARLGPTGLYSPVRIADKGEFVQTALDDLAHTLEFRGKYYKLASEDEVAAFIAAPGRYAAVTLPAAVPRRRTMADLKAAFPKQLEFGGFCPVTYVHGEQRYSEIKQGESEYVAEYDGAFYAFVSQDALDTFMRAPAKYHGLPLPKKLPPKLQPIAVGNLPMLGYMEQTASNIVTKALTAVGLKRPKYPFLSSQQSAEVYMAMFLKAHNPKSSDYTRSVWRAKLKSFEETCDMLKYLGETISADERDARPIDFDHKMAKFLALTR